MAPLASMTPFSAVATMAAHTAAIAALSAVATHTPTEPADIDARIGG